MTRWRLAMIAAAGVLLAAGAFGVYTWTRPAMAVSTADAAEVPTTRVERGTLELTVYMNGELRAARQQVVVAPPVGGTLRILQLLDTGTTVAEGEVVLAFDPADQLYALEQAESELREAEQEIIKSRADRAGQEAQDQVALLTARFDVRRAELEAQVDADLIPANEYRIRQVTFEEARRTLAQTERDVEARAQVGKAGLSVLEERRTKARLAADRARENIETLVVKAPMAGVVSVRDNIDAAGGFVFGGMALPPYRVGDTANPGRPVVDIVDVSGMEVRATVNEQERANVSSGQAVRLTSDAVPGVTLSAKVMSIAGLARPVQIAGPLGQFDVILQLGAPDPRLKPGTTVKIVTDGKRVEGMLLLPRQALFEADGQPVVYARLGGRFEAKAVKVLHRTENRVAVDGVEEGAEVALVNPSAGRASSGAASQAGPAVAR